MALQMNYYHSPIDTLSYNAYWRINPNHGIHGGKNKITYTIEVFKNAEMAHVENFKCLKGFSHSFIPDVSKDAPNILIQAYNHAKTVNYVGSVDV